MDAMDAMDAVALGARVQQVADKLLHKAQEARARGNAAAAQSLTESVSDLRHAAAVLVEQKRLLTVRQSANASDAAGPPSQQQPPSSSSRIQENGSDAVPRARLRRNSSASSVMSMLSTYEVGSVHNGSVAGSVAGSAHHSHSHSHLQSQQHQELVARLTRVEKMLGKKSDEMKAKGNESAANALLQSANYVRNGGSFIVEQQHTINALVSSQEKLQIQWRALSKILAREEQDERDDDTDANVLSKVAAIAAELTTLRGFLKTAFPECRDHGEVSELAAALQREREAAKEVKAVDENSQQLSADAVKALEEERNHLKQQLAEAKRVYEEEYLIAREDIEILKSENAMLKRQLQAAEMQNMKQNERELLEQQATYEAMMQAKEELKDVVSAHKQQLSDLATQVESWKTQFHDEQLKLNETLAANSKYADHIASLDQELKAQEETIAVLERTLKTKTSNEATDVPLLESGILSDDDVAVEVDADPESEVIAVKKLHGTHIEELKVLLSECEESLESERKTSAQFALERDALVARISEIEREHESELNALKSDYESRVAEIEFQRQIAQDETTKLQETLEKVEIEGETRERITSELKQAVDGYREECFMARKEVEEHDVVISRLQESLKHKEESVDDVRSQFEAKLSALRSDVQTLCGCLENDVDASPEVVLQSLRDLVLQSESKLLRDAFVVQMKRYTVLKQQFDRVQVDEQALREMSVMFLNACEVTFVHDADSAVTEIDERFSRVQVNVAKALDEINLLKESVEEKVDTERTLQQKLEKFSELQQQLSSATDAVHRLEQELETMEAEKASIASELHELKSKSIDGTGREEARAQEMEALEQRLKDVEAEYERYRGRSHTALKKVEKRAELLNGMRKENEQLKKQFADAEAECQRVLESEKNLVESLQEATQSQKMMQEEFQQRAVESAEQVATLEAQLVKLAEGQQIAKRELLEANEMVKKLEREKSELADTRNQFYEQERAAKEAELVDLKLQFQAKEVEAVALAEEIQKLKTQLKAHTAEQSKSASEAECLQAKLREFENAVAKLESELSAIRTTEQTSSNDADETVKKLQEELSRQQVAFAEEKATSEKQLAEMVSQVNQLKLEAKAAEDTILRLSQEISDGSVIAESAATVQERVESQAATVHEAELLTRLQEEKHTLETKHHEQEAQIAQLVSQATGYEHRIEFLEEQIGTLQNQLEEVGSSEHEQESLAAASSVNATKDDAIRELRRQVIDLQEQLQHFEEEHAVRELEQERGELVEIQAARMELQKKNTHALNLKQRKALVTTFKKHLHTVVDELQRGLDEYSAAFRDACEFRDAHSRRKADSEDSEAAPAAAAEDGPLPAEGASTEDVLPVESSLQNNKTPAVSSADEFEEYLVMNSGVVIKAGASFKLPVFCEKKGWRVVWTFSVKEDGADVGFALAAESADSKSNGDDGDRKLIVAPERVNTLSGVYNIEDDRGMTLMFEWDNTFSWLNEKTLDYHVSVQEPLSPEKKQIKVQERSLLSSSKQIHDGLAILTAEANSRAQLKSAVDHLRTSEQEKDAYLEQFNARKDDILQQKTALQQQMEELKTALSGMLSEQDEIEDDTRTLLKVWDGAVAEREDAETTIRLAERSQFENLSAQLEAQVQTLEQALLSFQDIR